jgi:hypothetical protein
VVPRKILTHRVADIHLAPHTASMSQRGFGLMDFGSLDPEVVEAIGRACDHFKAAWLHGSRPRIEISLEGTSGPLRSALLRALLAAEIALRADEGERPDLEDYLGRLLWNSIGFRVARTQRPPRRDDGGRAGHRTGGSNSMKAILHHND